ncbi:MAG: hypothetical protein PHN49_06010 [Candidatus Omnitrophica bacterium]|nr:hypothetical protein [Candidatus Omnitrophota bacterium]MDD5671173.1 hypothetical protein [Candidatus Omnitrophota bacterium]
MPLLRPVLSKTYFRIYEYLKEAVPLFLLTAVTMFTQNQIGVLDAFKHVLPPVVHGVLGLPESNRRCLDPGFFEQGYIRCSYD